MPSTPIYGFPFEEFSEQPGITLHGGLPPSSEILAEEVEEELSRVETGVIAPIEQRLAAVEATLAAIRWQHISAGTGGAGDFTLLVPAGFLQLRLTLYGDMDTTGDVQLRMNNDATSGRHISGFTATDMSNPQVDDRITFTGATGTVWTVGEWAATENNITTVHIAPVNGASNPAFWSWGGRQSTNATSHARQRAHGKYVQDVAISSIRVIDSLANFETVNWILEGYRAA